MADFPAGRDRLLPISILAAALMISGSVLFAFGGRDRAARPGIEIDVDREQLALLGELVAIQDQNRDVIVGDPNAPVTLVEYGDYQCPFCGRFFTQTEPLIREQYIKPGTVRMVYRNFAFLGPESFAAAEAAECAKDQKKFWAYHDVLYATEVADGEEFNGNLDSALFVAIARELDLDVGAFTECVESGTYASLIREQADEARAQGVDATPTLFVNGKKLVQLRQDGIGSAGALPFEDFTYQGGTIFGVKSVFENELKGVYENLSAIRVDTPRGN